MNNLKQRWGISGNFQFAVIIVVFAITGSSSAYLAKPVLAWMGITKTTMAPWLFYPLYILLIFPLYQALLLTFGFLSGQFKFFWAFEKRMLRALGLGFLFSEK